MMGGEAVLDYNEIKLSITAAAILNADKQS